MQIVVLLHSPRVAPQRGAIVPGIAPLDLAALRIGLNLATVARGKLTAITVGPADEEGVLREALASGAHRAVRIWSGDTASDSLWSISRLAATALSELGNVDLVLAGDQSANWGSGTMGPTIAHQLGLPHVSAVVDIRLAHGAFEIDRRVGGQRLTLQLDPPALLTVAAAPPLCATPRAGAADAAGTVVELFDLSDRTLTAPVALTPFSVSPVEASSAEVLAGADALRRQLLALGLAIGDTPPVDEE